MRSEDTLPLSGLNERDDSWTIAEGRHGDGPMLVRINTSAQRWAEVLIRTSRNSASGSASRFH
jgi:hypothetical protein